MPEPMPPSAFEDLGRAIARIAAEVALEILESRMPREPKKSAALVDIKGLACALDISQATVTRMMRKGCPVEYYGSKPKFDVEAVRAWARSREKASVSPPAKATAAPSGPIPGVTRKTRKGRS